MAKIQFSVPHDHGKDDAIKALKSFSKKMRANLPEGVSDVQENWVAPDQLEFSIQGMGMTVTGQLIAADDHVELNGNLPFAALPFRGMIESQLKSGITEALNPDSVG